MTLNGYVTANAAGDVSYWFVFDGHEAHHTISLARNEGRRVSDRVDGLILTSNYQWSLCSQASTAAETTGVQRPANGAHSRRPRSAVNR